MLKVGIGGRHVVRKLFSQIVERTIATLDALIADLLVSSLDRLLAVQDAVGHRDIASRAQVRRTFVDEMKVLVRAQYLKIHTKTKQNKTIN